MIRRLEIRAQDEPILRAWCGSAAKPVFMGSPIGDLSAVPVKVVSCLELGAGLIRVVADEGTVEVPLGPPPECPGLFRYGGGWFGTEEDCKNLYRLLEDASDAVSIDRAVADRAAGMLPTAFDDLVRILGL